MHSPNAICDRCGFKHPLSALRKEWTGLRVCAECWDYRHPQEFVRAVRDTQGVRPNMRPRPADVYVEAPLQDDLYGFMQDDSGGVITG